MNEIIYKSGLEDKSVFKLTPKRSFKGILKELKEDKHAIRDVTKLRLEDGGGLIIIEYHKRPKEVYIFKNFSNATKYYNYFRKVLRGAL